MPKVLATFGRAKSVMWIYLSGGPSQYETFDPRPDAPAEIRGTFSPIATSVAGVQFCELLPRISTIAHKLAVVRSFATDDPNHKSAGYWINTGHKYAGPDMRARALALTAWPTLGSIIRMLKPTEGCPFSSVMLPEAIIAIGEMGRTPKFNASGGRDHWGNVFSFAMAGAGIRPGQVYGASDRDGAYPARD